MYDLWRGVDFFEKGLRLSAMVFTSLFHLMKVVWIEEVANITILFFCLYFAYRILKIANKYDMCLREDLNTLQS